MLHDIYFNFKILPFQVSFTAQLSPSLCYRSRLIALTLVLNLLVEREKLEGSIVAAIKSEGMQSSDELCPLVNVDVITHESDQASRQTEITGFCFSKQTVSNRITAAEASEPRRAVRNTCRSRKYLMTSS